MRKKLLLAIVFSLGIWSYMLVMAMPSRIGSAAIPPATDPARGDDGITALFSPSGGCTEAIVSEIGKAAQSLDIQAYVFTSPAISGAVLEANKRGVHIRIVLDKSQRSDHNSAATLLANRGIPVYVDDQHGIAHNKLILIDGKVLITGSFNFSKASEERNAENLLIIRNHPKLMADYQANFERHQSHSVPLQPAAM